jgi:hypothetical protein
MGLSGGRSAELDRRIATHEAGHALVARWLGTIVELVTIRPSDGFAGRCVRRGASPLNLLDAPGETIDVAETCTRIGAPVAGENRAELAPAIVTAQTLMIELMAGLAAERALFPGLPTLDAPHDLREAEALASTCASPAAVDALVSYAEHEASAIIAANVDVLRALADALVERGELSGGQVDAIIASAVSRRQAAVERERRADWRRRERNARRFAAMVESATATAGDGR